MASRVTTPSVTIPSATTTGVAALPPAPTRAPILPMYDLTFIDNTQFAADPLRTGVQRVLIKVIEHMPRDRIMPFRVVDRAHVAILDPAIFDIAIRFFRNATPTARTQLGSRQGTAHASSEEEFLVKLLARHPLSVLKTSLFFARVDRVFNLESFSSAERSLFYSSCAPSHRHKVFHFIHDFLLFESPQLFPQLNWRFASDYMLLFEAYCCAGGFLVATQAMAGKVARYFNRTADDIRVVHFGGDVSPVQPRPPAEKGSKRHVLVVGTIEPRKYPLVVFQALERLAVAHSDVICTVAGNWGWVDAEARGRIDAVFKAGHVHHEVGLQDASLVDRMSMADVAIYLSSNEGFGLPVIEFAAMGIPVVTNSAVPAPATIPPHRAAILETVDIEGIVAGVERLLEAHPGRDPYYTRTWAQCAEEIFDWRPFAHGERDPDIDSLGCWRSSIRLMRELRPLDLDWEKLKREVARSFSANPQITYALFRAGRENVGGGRLADLIEVISETVSDNRQLVHWADLIQLDRLLAEFVRAMTADNYLDGLSRAFLAFLGRPIDGRAASEAMGLTKPEQVFGRIVDLVFCIEATASLGHQTASPLRRIVGAIVPVVPLCLGDHVDLFKLNEALQLPQPSLQDVIMVEDLLRSHVDRLELLVYLAHARPVCGDEIDLFLETAARICQERDSGLLAGHKAAGDNDSAASAGSQTPSRSGVSSKLARSHLRALPLSSAAFGDGWYGVEYAGKNSFRWMQSRAVVVNPDPARSVLELLLDVQAVYGADQPAVSGKIGEAPVQVIVEQKRGSQGWRVRMRNSTPGSSGRVLHVHAQSSASPADAEGSEDDRELSLCVTGATITYRD